MTQEQRVQIIDRLLQLPSDVAAGVDQVRQAESDVEQQTARVREEQQHLELSQRDLRNAEHRLAALRDEVTALSTAARLLE